MSDETATTEEKPAETPAEPQGEKPEGKQYIRNKVVTAYPKQKDGIDGYQVTDEGDVTKWWPKEKFEERFRELPEEGKKFFSRLFGRA